MSESLADEIARGEGIGAAQAAKRFPSTRSGKPCHPATITRRILAGERGAVGQRVRLEAVRMGSQWVTTPGAIRRYVAALRIASEAAPRTPTTDRATEVRHLAAERELESMGI